MSAWRGWVRRFAAGLAASVAVLAVAAPARAAAAGCTGVAVVVDFSAFGGGVDVRCAGDPATGYDALHEVGFSTEGTQHDGPGYICRINGLPTVEQDRCVLTPPVSKYWSYWHAVPGGQWHYSQSGPSSYNPAPGTVDGWSFGAGSPPGIAPPAAPAPDPPPANPPGGGTGGGGTGGGGAGGGAGGGTGGAPATPEPTAEPTPEPTESPSGSSLGPSTSAAPRSSTVDAVPVANSAAGGGINGTLLGAGLIAVLAGLAGIIALRRRTVARAVTPAHAEDGEPGG